MMNLKTLVVAVTAFAASLLSVSASVAAGPVFAVLSVHPVPGSQVSIGGGGVLYNDGTAYGIVAPTNIDEGELFIAHLTEWNFLSEDTILLCFELDQWIGFSPEPSDRPLDVCLPLLLNEANLVNDAYLTPRVVGNTR
jgi:hypothetical protein